MVFWKILYSFIWNTKIDAWHPHFQRGVTPFKSMWNTMECKRDSSSGAFGGARETIDLYKHRSMRETHWERVSHRHKNMWNTAVGIKNCKQLFSLRLAFTTKKSNMNSGDDFRTMCCYFLGRKCKQWWKVVYSFRYRLSPGQVGREVFHMLLNGLHGT